MNTSQGRDASSARRTTLPFRSPKIMTALLFVGASCFYAGLMLGAHTGMQRSVETDCSSTRNDPENPEKLDKKRLEQRITKQSQTIDNLAKQLKASTHRGGHDDTQNRFPKEMELFAGGLASVDREEFVERFDMGIPLDKSEPKNKQVLLFYSSEKAMPTTDPFKADEAKANTEIPYIDDVEQAVENCDTLNVILTQPREWQQCFAFVGQYRSFHLQKFMRLPEDGGKLDQSAPLRFVNRGAQSSGRLSARSPTKRQTTEYWKTLAPYLQNLDTTLEELSPIAESVARNNTVVVMTVNHGQVELLMNFVCSSRAKGVDISPLLVFATDQETKELAEAMGLKVFFDQKVSYFAYKLSSLTLYLSCNSLTGLD